MPPTRSPGKQEALLVVDVQNDFCPGGALPVPQGDEIVPVVNRLARRFAHSSGSRFAAWRWIIACSSRP